MKTNGVFVCAIAVLAFTMLPGPAKADSVVLGITPGSGSFSGLSAPTLTSTPSFGQFLAQPFTLTQSVFVSSVNYGIWGSGNYPLLFQLTNLVGPQSTPSNVLAMSATTFVHPSSASGGDQAFQWVSTGVGVWLTPGTYYLVVSTTQPQVPLFSPPLVLGWDSFGTPMPSTVGFATNALIATGNTPFLPQSFIDTGFPPASNFVPFGQPPLTFELVGHAAVPEPSTILLAGSGTGFLWLRRRKWKRPN